MGPSVEGVVGGTSVTQPLTMLGKIPDRGQATYLPEPQLAQLCNGINSPYFTGRKAGGKGREFSECPQWSQGSSGCIHWAVAH